MIITGIGSRKTPPEICKLFMEFGEKAALKGWWIRSGHANGADYAFEQGARDRCIVYLPWKGFNKEAAILGRLHTEPYHERTFDIVKQHEPPEKIEKMSQPIKLLKCRNVYQVLGLDLRSPSDLVICWTPDGRIMGG